MTLKRRHKWVVKIGVGPADQYCSVCKEKRTRHHANKACKGSSASYVVQQYDRFDGWFQVHGPTTMTACSDWIKNSGLPTEEDAIKGYVRIFPVNTTMLQSSEVMDP